MEKFEELGISCLALNLESLTRPEKFFAKRRLKQWLLNHQVTCIHAQHFCVFSDVCNAGEKSGAKSQIVTEHTAELYGRGIARVIKAARKKASCIIAINGVVQEAICRISGFPRPGVIVIQNGIDTSRFVPAEKSRREHCEIIWLGRLHPDKDVMNGLRAFREALQVNPMLHLNVVGDGDERGKAEGYIREHELQDHVCFTGELADPCETLQQADIFLLSSATEGTPLAMLEALSCGLPVVSTAVGGIPDIISNEVGVLAPPGDPAALASGILTLAENPILRTQMSINARHLAEGRFSERNMAMAYIKLIDRDTK
jgi:glycosyltransferase involved in cell wall biosynthesis